MTRRISDLRLSEAWCLTLLRLWPEGPEAQALVWTGLCRAIGPGRARACLSGFETLHALIRAKSWQMPQLNAPDAETLSADEDTLCRLILAATEGGAEAAMEEACFLLRPDALLPFCTAAGATGLPLLCTECRARICGTRDLNPS
ncbi:hypothetical protein [Litorisediminicola beolgyonensis]|uniref:Uncharacterized protein n=1 Tax=Litorisediminicola beolgyonensis TaxID=1173614 RepID=A0ABW3ZDE1_9RHOB